MISQRYTVHYLEQVREVIDRQTGSLANLITACRSRWRSGDADAIAFIEASEKYRKKHRCLGLQEQAEREKLR